MPYSQSNSFIKPSLNSTFSQLILLFLFLSSSVLALELSSKLIEVVERKFGSAAVKRIQQWEKIANLETPLEADQKLHLVNSFFNQAEFVNDIDHWGKEDYWATPIELLATNAGDCEDYSIAKYFTLRELGIPDDQMKITYVKAVKLNQAHMVLAYYPEPGAEPLILDNLVEDIKPASKRPDLVPVYSFNGEGLWLSKLRGQEGKRLGKSTKLDSWKDLLYRHSIMMD